MRDRIETIHRFRIQLILSLHERFVVNGHTAANSANNSSSGSGWLFGSSVDPDLAYQSAVREKFPFLDLTNPVIFDTSAILLNGKNGLFDSAAAALNGKTGTIYLTLDHLMFYAAGGILFAANPEIVVIPLRTVALLEIVDVDSTLISCLYAGEEGALISVHNTNSVVVHPPPNSNNSKNAATTITLDSGMVVPANARLPSTIRLVDSTGTVDMTVEVKGLTVDYTRRVGDLLDLILRVSIHILLLCDMGAIFWFIFILNFSLYCRISCI